MHPVYSLAFKHSSQHVMHNMPIEKTKSECSNIFSTLHTSSPKSPNEANRKHHHHCYFQIGSSFQVDVYTIFWPVHSNIWMKDSALLIRNTVFKYSRKWPYISKRDIFTFWFCVHCCRHMISPQKFSKIPNPMEKKNVWPWVYIYITFLATRV